MEKSPFPLASIILTTPTALVLSPDFRKPLEDGLCAACPAYCTTVHSDVPILLSFDKNLALCNPVDRGATISTRNSI